MKRLKVGVIGLGHMGRNHVRNYAENIGYFELVGVYDTDNEVAKKVAEQYSTVAFDTLEELLENVEAVSVVVPSSLHRKIGFIVAEHNVHALIEKPIALNSEDAEAITEKYKENNLVLQVGHIERFNPVITELQKIIENKRVIFAETHRYGPFSGSGRIVDTSVVEDLMIHDIDLLCHIFRPVKVVGLDASGEKIRSGNIDFATAMLDFDNASHAITSVSRVSQGKERLIEIHCEDCLIVADLINKSLTVSQNTDLVVNLEMCTFKQDGIVQKIFVPIVEPLKQELLSFYNAVVNETPVEVTGEMATEAVRLCEEVVRKINNKNSLVTKE